MHMLHLKNTGSKIKLRIWNGDSRVLKEVLGPSLSLCDWTGHMPEAGPVLQTRGHYCERA